MGQVRQTLEGCDSTGPILDTESHTYLVILSGISTKDGVQMARSAHGEPPQSQDATAKCGEPRQSQDAAAKWMATHVLNRGHTPPSIGPPGASWAQEGGGEAVEGSEGGHEEVEGGVVAKRGQKAAGRRAVGEDQASEEGDRAAAVRLHSALPPAGTAKFAEIAEWLRAPMREFAALPASVAGSDGAEVSRTIHVWALGCNTSGLEPFVCKALTEEHGISEEVAARIHFVTTNEKVCGHLERPPSLARGGLNEGPPLRQVHSDRFIFLLHRFVSVWEASGNTPDAVDLVRGCRRVLNHGQDVWRKLRNGHDQGDSDTAWGDRLQGSTLATLRPQHRG